MSAHAPRSPRRVIIGAPFAWLLLFALLPLVLVLKISTAQVELGVPPYTPFFGVDAAGNASIQASAANFKLIASDSLYLDAYLNSLRIAAISTLLALLLGYPMAYAIATAPMRWRVALLILVLLPFWTSFLIRVYAWVALLRPTGPLNSLLLSLGVVDQPLATFNTEFAVYIGMVFCYLPYMILPLYARLEKQDPQLLEAAADLGASPLRAFLGVTLPLSVPGIVAGCLLMFIPAVGEFVIPELLGGAGTLM
ncbi:MAG: ABC transporter permease subunit, partial [Rhodospirillaceae bacterium]|nr:ABC transporter permease subunit [Rhodospirillaceae bacterium]